MTLAEKVLGELLKRLDLPDSVSRLVYYLVQWDSEKYHMSLNRSEYGMWSDPIDTSTIHIPYVTTLHYILSSLPEISEEGTFQSTIGDLAGLDADDLYSITRVGEWQFHPQSRPKELSDRSYSQFLHDIRKTIWYKLLDFNVSFTLPDRIRFEHTYVLGASGSGKTTLIQQLIAGDVPKGCVIVIDSQRDLINKLKASTLIPADRLVIIEPEDCIRHPLAFNMFNVTFADDPVDRQRQMGSVISLFNFVFSSIMTSALTDKQQLVFTFSIQLMLAVPKATIFTFVDLLQNGIEKYQEYIKDLPRVAQTFFEIAFTVTKRKNEYDETKDQILRRLLTLLANEVIANFFTSTESKFNIGREMDAGKVILISTDKGLLKDMTAFFGRFFLAQIAQAMQERANTAEQSRIPTYLYIDEAYDYFSSDDENIVDILAKGRKYKVGVTIAHHNSSQIPAKVFDALRVNTGTKFIGGIQHADFNALKHDMHIETQSRRPFTFQLYSRGTFDEAIEVNPTRNVIENYPRRTEHQIEYIMRENRAKYSAGKPQEEPTPEAPPEDDIDSFNKA